MDKIEVGGKLVAVKINGKLLVDNSVFNGADIALRGEATGAFMKAGGDIQFVENFKKFADYKDIIKRLKVGEDVTAELAFNGITSDGSYMKAFQAYQDAVAPIIDVLTKLIPPYPFAKKPDGATSRLTFGTKSVQKGSYKMSVTTCQSLWQHVSPWWAGKTSVSPGSKYVQSGGGRYADFSKTTIEIGCQSVHRWEVEEMAQHYGWAFPTP